MSGQCVIDLTASDSESSVIADVKPSEESQKEHSQSDEPAECWKDEKKAAGEEDDVLADIFSLSPTGSSSPAVGKHIERSISLDDNALEPLWKHGCGMEDTSDLTNSEFISRIEEDTTRELTSHEPPSKKPKVIARSASTPTISVSGKERVKNSKTKEMKAKPVVLFGPLADPDGRLAAAVKQKEFTIENCEFVVPFVDVVFTVTFLFYLLFTWCFYCF